MLPGLEKKRGRLSKRDEMKLWALTRRNISSAPEECVSSEQRASSSSRLQIPYSSTRFHHRSLPVIREPTALLEARQVEICEPERLPGPKDDKLRVCIKKWKKKLINGEEHPLKVCDLVATNSLTILIVEMSNCVHFSF